MTFHEEIFTAPETFSDTEVPVLSIETDADMLANVIDTPGVEFDDDLIAKLNDLVEATHLKQPHTPNKFKFMGTTAISRGESGVRHDFYRALSWLKPEHALHTSWVRLNSELQIPPPPKRVIPNLRNLYDYTGNELVFILANDCRVLNAPTQKLETNLATLASAECDPLTILAVNPYIILTGNGDQVMIERARKELRKIEKRADAENRRALIGSAVISPELNRPPEIPITLERRESLAGLAQLMGIEPDMLFATPELVTCENSQLQRITSSMKELADKSDDPIPVRRVLIALRNDLD